MNYKQQDIKRITGTIQNSSNLILTKGRVYFKL